VERRSTDHGVQHGHHHDYHHVAEQPGEEPAGQDRSRVRSHEVGSREIDDGRVVIDRTLRARRRNAHEAFMKIR
jgi:hypothetical protein